MIRTILEAGDGGQPMRTIEFDEKQIVLRELIQTGTEGPPSALIITLCGRAEPITITDPEAMKKLWRKTGKK